MLTFPKLSKLTILLLLCLSVISLSACSKKEKYHTGVDPAPHSTAGNAVTSNYASKPATVEKGEPNSQVDPYTGSNVKENYAGKHNIAPDQTAGEHLDKAKQNMKEATHKADENMKEAGKNVKDASVRLKDKVKSEFTNQ